MATIREVILSNQQKEDGTYNVKIRVIHQRKVYYLKTQHFIRQNQLRKDNTIKDPIILRAINPVIDGYRTKISELGPKLELYNMSRLINYLTNNDLTAADQVDVIEFGRKRIEELNAAGRKASASNMSTVINSLVDYFKSDFVPITEIRAKTLLDYEKYYALKES
jgi:hypothetical protein